MYREKNFYLDFGITNNAEFVLAIKYYLPKFTKILNFANSVAKVFGIFFLHMFCCYCLVCMF